MSRSRYSGGGNKKGDKVVWFFLMGGLLVAFWQIPYDPGVSGVRAIAESKVATVETWVKGIAPGISDAVSGILKGGSTKPAGPTASPSDSPYIDDAGNPFVPEPGVEVPDTQINTRIWDLPRTGDTATTEDIKTKVDTLPVGAKKADYNRDDWNHWVRTDRSSCWDVRDEVLERDALPGTVKYADKDKKATTDPKKACSVTAGTWVDPYSGVIIKDPKGIDIDHMIPLSYANQHGGASFSKKQKEEYANDLSNPVHLKATAAKENRTKSDKGPSGYKPPNQSNWCVYARDWVTISSNWGLSISEKDVKAVREMLATC